MDIFVAWQDEIKVGELEAVYYQVPLIICVNSSNC
jgi:hypothetical protein